MTLYTHLISATSSYVAIKETARTIKYSSLFPNTETVTKTVHFFGERLKFGWITRWMPIVNVAWSISFEAIPFVCFDFRGFRHLLSFVLKQKIFVTNFFFGKSFVLYVNADYGATANMLSSDFFWKKFCSLRKRRLRSNSKYVVIRIFLEKVLFST
jgi:hypothetical protein